MLGHGEGGYIAPLVASRPENRIAFVIMVAGPAASGKEVLLAQNRALLAVRNASADEVAAQIGFVDTLATLLLNGDPDQARQYAIEHDAALPPEPRQPGSVMDRFINTNFTSFLGYDPAAALESLRIPVSAIFGSKDLQVPVDQNAPLARTLLASDPDADVHVFDGSTTSYRLPPRAARTSTGRSGPLSRRRCSNISPAGCASAYHREHTDSGQPSVRVIATGVSPPHS
ncbi:alpha/beta fold hydrolase [Nocardia vaccinii]|uniref:alpha/beta fold hydrolase n=1 Tax=Nocardia vaccinii TaxID=1822 RepID=UPI00082A65E6|nr:alpha/beta hydrolase [Nocardia vaccinii]